MRAEARFLEDQPGQEGWRHRVFPRGVVDQAAQRILDARGRRQRLFSSMPGAGQQAERKQGGDKSLRGAGQTAENA